MQVRHAFESPMLALLRHRPQIHLPAAQQLLALCQNQTAQETFPGWMTFWSLAAHYFNGLCQASERELTLQEVSASSQIMSGLLLRQSFDPSQETSLEGLDLINHLLFLEQADVITQRLVSILDECSQEQQPQVPEALQLDAHHMAQLAQEVSLNSVHEVADALASQLARLRTTRIVSDIKTSLQGAQEVSRLLHQFAVGNVRAPQESVLAALRGN